MTHGVVKVCAICKEKITCPAMVFRRFSSHIMNNHKDDKTVQKIQELNLELSNAWASLLKETMVFHNKDELNKILEEEVE